nr:MAG TPA: tail length tape measure protein [Caudoviricetes sp.]
MADTASLIVRVNAEGVDKASKQLDSFATAAETAERASNKLPNATKTAEASIKKLGHVAGQAGFQLSDFVVQVQGGTSAFTAFAQQGGQLFGAISPIAGLVATVAGVVGGALYNSLSDATDKSAQLATGLETVKDALDVSRDGTYAASDAFEIYVNQGASVADINNFVERGLQSLAAQAVTTAQQIVAAAQAINDGYSFLERGVANLAASTIAQSGNIAGAVEFQTKAWEEATGATEEQRKQIKQFSQAVEQGLPGATEAFKGWLDTVTDGGKSGTVQLKALRNEVYRVSDLQRDQLAQEKGFANIRESLAKQQQERQSKADELARRIAEREAKRGASAVARETAAAQRQQKAADTFLATLARQNSDELAAVKAQEEQKLATLNEFYAKGNIDQQAYEEAKTQIVTDAEAKRNEIITKQRDELMKKQMSADAYVAQMQALGEGEFAELDRQYSIKLKKLDDFHAQGLVSEQDYQASLNAMNSEYALDRAKATSNAFGSMASNIGSALGEASGAYKAFAIVQATIATYTAAIEAYKSTAAIPIVGPFLAPVAAAAAVGAGMAQVSAIRSAREQGGQLAAGQASTIAERGKPEVIMPANASRVRTVQQMKEMMGQDSKSGGDNVTIVNNTTGRVDSAVTERDDEGRLRIIISETVASQLQDNNSPISKARRSTRGRPGY